MNEPGKHSYAYHVCAKNRAVSVRGFEIPVSLTSGLSLFQQVVEADVNTPFGATDGGVDVCQVLRPSTCLQPVGFRRSCFSTGLAK